MFTIKKSDLELFYRSDYGDFIYEYAVSKQQGANDKEYMFTLDQAVTEAYNSAVYNAKRRVEQFERRISKYNRCVLNFRALFNKNIKETLRIFDENLKAAKDEYEKILSANPESLFTVVYLPDSVSFLGYQLAVGQEVFVVDSYSYSISKQKICGIDLYTRDGFSLLYRTETISFNPTLRSSDSNKHIFFNKQDAIKYLVNVIEAQKNRAIQLAETL